MTTFTIRATSPAVNPAGTALGQSPDNGAPSYWDVIVTNSSDPLVQNGTYDGYCLNLLASLQPSPAVYDSTENYDANNPATLPTALAAIQMTHLTAQQIARVNWILSQNFTSDSKFFEFEPEGGLQPGVTASAFNYGEVQYAIWKVVGYTDAQIAGAGITPQLLSANGRQVMNLAQANFLVDQSLAAINSGINVLPPDTFFAQILDPGRAGDPPATQPQPLIIQLNKAKLGNFVWEDVNGDGDQDAGEMGIDNVVVQLLDQNGNVISTTTTGDDYSTAAVEKGYYQFAGLQAGTYQVRFITPANFIATVANAGGDDAADSDAVNGDSQQVVLDAAESDQTIDAGFVRASSISGYVYCDDDDDGVRDGGEVGIGGVEVRLTGTDLLGNAVSTTVFTNADGSYSFNGLRAGNYTVTEVVQPAGKLDGKDTAGNIGGVPTGTAGNDVISNISLGTGEDSVENNFGEILPAAIRGFVYCDDDNDGVRDAGEVGLGGVPVRLQGTDDRGNVVDVTINTNADGSYAFEGLRPGTYSVTEAAQPAGKLDGKDTAGTPGGGTAGNETITGITLTPGLESEENNFGEILPSSISGFVYCDDDNDGVKDAGEMGIGGVPVRLQGTDDRGNSIDVTINTNADGSYSFTDLRPGTYSVTEAAQPAGKLDGKDTAGTINGVTTGVAGNETVTGITLGQNQNSVNNNFGEVTPAAIRGFVYCDDDNDGVKDASEVGLGGVPVRLQGTDDLGNLIDVTINTNADGSYAFEGLRPGTYSVTEAAQPAGKLDGKDTAGTPGGGTAGNETITGITLTPGLESNNNNFGEVLPSSISGFVYCDDDNDGVKDAGEMGIGGVPVRLTGTDDLGNPVDTTINTNADGSYSFTGLRPGTYAVTEVAQPAGKDDGKDTAGTINGVTTGTAGNETITGITLGAGQDSVDNNFGEIQAASSISGYVYCDDDNDGVRDAGETGIGGVEVRLTGTDILGNAVSATAFTNADGSYSFTGLRAGDYTVTEFVQPAGKLDGKDTAGNIGGVPTGTAGNDVISNITLGTAQDSVENNFGEILAGAIRGFVYCDDDNDGVKDAGEVGLGGVPVRLQGIDDLGNPVDVTINTNADGSYAFDGLRPGTYSVTEAAQPAGKLDGKDTAGTPGGGTAGNETITGITITPGLESENNNFGEVLPSSISGFVYCDDDNDGVKDAGEMGIGGAPVRLQGADDLGNPVDTTINTNADGSYSFTGLRPGTYSVTEVAQPAGKDDGKDTAGTINGVTTGTAGNETITGITLGAGQDSVNNNFGEIQAASSISGYVYCDDDNDGVRDAGEVGIGGVEVRLSGTDILGNAVSATAFTNADGSYAFNGLRAGNYTVTEFVQPAGKLDGKDTAGNIGGVPTGTAGNDVISNITLGTGQASVENNFGEILPAAIRGFVYCDDDNDGVKDAGEVGLGGVPVRLQGTNDRGVAIDITINTNADGSYAFDGLRPGTYSVTEAAQPPGKLDGKDTAGTPGGGTAGSETITGITLTPGLESNNNNFGEILPSSISGFVYCDDDNDGVKDAGEMGIGGVPVRLQGVNDRGVAVDITINTNADGSYSFTGLRPGTYSVTEVAQPAGKLDGKDTAGTINGVTTGTAGNETITGITLGANQNSVNNNFGEIQKARIGDFVWEDKDADGFQDANENGIAGVTVQLKNAAGTVVATTTTGANGNYFFDVAPGTYSIGIVPPANYFVSPQNAGADDAKDSDISATTLMSQQVTVGSGEQNLTLDAGLFRKASVGDKVFLDCDMDGKQDAGEPGVAGVTVKLLNAAGAVVATTATNANGEYNFSNLMPGTYSVQFVKPANYSFTTKDAAGTTDANDSDADVNTGNTAQFTLMSGENRTDVDAGLTAPKQCLTFDFSGNTATDGHDGNIRSYIVNGVAVNVSAFARDKASGAWSTAYVGAYGGGLGVTDNAEGSGAGNTHTVDNTGGRDNYLVFEFNQDVTLDSAFLGFVSGDSDIQVWIGKVDGAFNNHITLSDSVLANMGFTEVNTTTLTTARTADLNALLAQGNVIIIAADTTDTTPEDFFKLQQLLVCTNPCVDPTKGSIGDKAFHDLNYNGIQDAGEGGIAGVTVQLLNSAGTVLRTTTTDANGNYLFADLMAGDYKVSFAAPAGSGFLRTKANQGLDDAKDSDASQSTGVTGLINLSAGEHDRSVDAGFYKKAMIGDRVWEDMDHDGIQDAGEPGIGGIRVSLLDKNWNVVATTTTNSSGNYSFMVDPGEYRLKFDKANVYHVSGWGGTANMSNWFWGIKDVNGNTMDTVDSDVTKWSDAYPHWSYTALTTLTSGENDKTWDAAITPIAIDLDGDGVQTVSRANSGGKFDLFGNGNAVASGWIENDDGLLAIDGNGNGVIDDISELFGGSQKGAGFAKLAAFDSNGDGKVDASDARFSELLVWQDADGDHKTDAGELMSLHDAGIASIDTGYVEVPFADANGNLHLERSSATRTDGRTADVTDVYFNVAREDADAAGVKLASLADLLGSDTLDLSGAGDLGYGGTASGSIDLAALVSSGALDAPAAASAAGSSGCADLPELALLGHQSELV